MNTGILALALFNIFVGGFCLANAIDGHPDMALFNGLLAAINFGLGFFNLTRV